MLSRTIVQPAALILSCLFSSVATADVVTVAVASNFAEPARQLAERFEQATGQRVRISTGSTGKHYAQIVAGAPFDVFLAADVERPERLVDEGVGSRSVVYAIGKPVLVSADPSLAGKPCIDAFAASDGSTLAIANPETAPYGRAATEWLDSLDVMPRIVTGENVAQAMHFVMSGNARFGVVAESQLLVPAWELKVFPGCFEALPAGSHTAVRQAAVQLSDAGGPFFDFIMSEESQALIASFGYSVSGAE